MVLDLERKMFEEKNRKERALNMGNAVIILPSKWMDKNQPPLNFLLSSFGQLNLNSNGKNKKESFEENEPVFVSNSNLNGFFKIAQKGETI